MTSFHPLSNPALLLCALLALPVMALAQSNSDFSAETGIWADGEGPMGWNLVLATGHQGIVADFPRSEAGGRAFRFTAPTPNFGTNRLEQCLPIAGLNSLRLRTWALTDTPNADLRVRLRMDFFADDACEVDSEASGAERIESDLRMDPALLAPEGWTMLDSEARLVSELGEDVSHVRISVRIRDRSDGGEAAEPALQLWFDRVQLLDTETQFSAVDRAALLALYQASNGDDWSVNSGWGGPAGTECNWFGVHCDEDGQQVTALDLAWNGLSGSLPQELRDLSQLRPGDGLKLCWNQLDADEDLAAFVNDHHLGADWISCQNQQPAAPSRGLTGSWTTEDRAGERVLVTMLADQTLMLDWMSFDEAGNPLWLTSLGKARQRQFEIDALLKVARSGQDGDTSLSVEHAGNAELVFTGCDTARLAYQAEIDGTLYRGARMLQRIDSELPQICETPDEERLAFNGHWFDNQRSGEGLVIHGLGDSMLAVYWLSYADDGRAEWLSAQVDAQRLKSPFVVLNLQRTSGGDFEGAIDEQQLTRKDARLAVLRVGDGELDYWLLGDALPYAMQRVVAGAELRASAPFRLYLSMDQDDLNTLYSRNLFSDERLPGQARLSADGPVQTLDGVRFRGNTSRRLPKKGFNIRFDERQPALFGSDRMNLNAAWTDPLMFREALAMALFRDLGHPAPRTRRFDLFINGIYEGLYTHLERVDGDLVAAYGLAEGTLVRDQFREDSDTGTSAFGFALETIPADERVEFISERFDFRGNPDWQAVVELIEWVRATPAGPAFEQGFRERINDVRFRDWVAVHFLIGDIDSWGNDYWLHQDPDAADPRWNVIPWDKDLSFGSHFRASFGVANDYFFYMYPLQGGWGNQLLSRYLATPALRAELNERVLELSTEVFNGEYFASEVQAMTETLLDSIEINAEFQGTFQRHPAQHHGAEGLHALHREVLLDFIELRSRYIDRQINRTGAPTNIASANLGMGVSSGWFTDGSGWTLGTIERTDSDDALSMELAVQAQPDAQGIDRVWTLQSEQALSGATLSLYYRNDISDTWGGNWVTEGSAAVGTQSELQPYRVGEDCLLPVEASRINPYANKAVLMNLDVHSGENRYVLLTPGTALAELPICD